MNVSEAVYRADIATLGKKVAALEAELARLKEYVPIVAALAVYGEDASLPALVAKARELNEASC